MTGQQDIFQQAMNQGHSAAWDQMWDKAAGYYRQALEEFPNNAQALTSLGLALIELQDYDESLKCYIQAAKALPEDPMPMEKVAQLNERMGNLDQAVKASLRAAELYLKNHDASKAIENWERVTRLNPDNLQAHSRLALIFERMGDKQRAVKEFLAAASLLQSAGELEKAIQAVNQALKAVPNNDEATQALGMLRDLKPLPKPSRPRGATAPLRMSQVRQLQAPPETARAEGGMDPVTQGVQKALTVLAGMLFEGTEDELSEQASRKGLQAIVTGTTGMLRKPVDRNRMMLHLSQVVDLQTRGQTVQAAEELLRAMDVGLEHQAAYFNLGYLHSQVGRLESAYRYLQHAVKNPDYSLGARLLMGDILRKRGKMKDAAIEFLEALRLADGIMVPENQANDLRQLYEPYIEAYRQRDDFSMQERLCDNVYGLLMRPDWKLHVSRARQQLPKRGAKDLPLPLAEVLTEARSSEVIEAISTIYDLAQKGLWRSAIEEAFFALQNAPTYLPLHTLMGEVLVKQSDFPAAVAKFEAISRAYNIRGETQQALNMYRRVVELAPTDLNARGYLIEQLLVNGQSQNAIGEYMQLADLYVSLADLTMARKTFTEGLRVAQQSNAERPVRVKILHRMADIDVQSLDWRQALRIYDQICTLQPDDDKARTSLVELNFRLGQEQQGLTELDSYLAYLNSNSLQEKALGFLEALVAEDPKRTALRRRLADFYWHLGRNKNALAQLDTIGDILMDSGDLDGAIKTIEMILVLNPPNREDYQQLLDQIRKQQELRTKS